MRKRIGESGAGEGRARKAASPMTMTPPPSRGPAGPCGRAEGACITAARSTTPREGLKARRSPWLVSGKIEGPARPLCDSSGPIPKELFTNRPAEASR